MEASSQKNDGSLTPFPGLLLSWENGGWCWKLQASNHAMFFLMPALSRGQLVVRPGSAHCNKRHSYHPENDELFRSSLLGTQGRDQSLFPFILHSPAVLYCPPPLTRSKGRRVFGIHVLACIYFSLLNCKLLEDQNHDFISVSPEPKVAHERQYMLRAWMNGHLQRLTIKYFTFSSNPKVIVGLSGFQINLPSSIFPTANSMGRGSPRLSLDCLQILGFRDSLVLSASSSAPPPHPSTPRSAWSSCYALWIPSQLHHLPVMWL